MKAAEYIDSLKSQRYSLKEENLKLREALQGAFDDLMYLSAQGIFPSLWLDRIHEILTCEYSLDNK